VIQSSRRFTKIDIAKCLEAGQGTNGKRLFAFENISYTVELIDLTFNDHTRGYVILLAPVDFPGSDISDFLTIIIVTYLLAFILTNILVPASIPA
jgi:hypothetical protein